MDHAPDVERPLGERSLSRVVPECPTGMGFRRTVGRHRILARMTHTPAAGRPLRIGMVGSGFMAQQHSAAYQLLRNVLGDAVPEVELVRIAGGRNVHRVGPRYGWSQTSDDWQSVTEADDIDVVDIVTPNDSHGYLVASAAAAGKQIVCEKPLAPDLATAEQMGRDVAAAGVRAAVCFVYRTWPAIQVARSMIEAGRLGTIHGYRGCFLHDHFADPAEPGGLRLDPAKAGSGVIGDIGSHALDLARHLVGDVATIATRTRSLISGGVDDEAELQLEFAQGATGHIWLSWLASGTPMDVGFHVMGDRGALKFTWSRSSELSFYDATAPAAERGFRTIQLGPAHAPARPYLPIAGAGLSYQAAFVPLLGAFLSDDPIYPSLADGVTISRYLDAALASAADGSRSHGTS